MQDASFFFFCFPTAARQEEGSSVNQLQSPAPRVVGKEVGVATPHGGGEREVMP